ncbi:MAG: hypothetical protein K0R57_2145 [Paenibacillaceae bacterium]|jgi:hypothetical protein|nr:hypothetical protein [Paenibacillaceae bacterium]
MNRIKGWISIGLALAAIAGWSWWTNQAEAIPGSMGSRVEAASGIPLLSGERFSKLQEFASASMQDGYRSSMQWHGELSGEDYSLLREKLYHFFGDKKADGSGTAGGSGGFGQNDGWEIAGTLAAAPAKPGNEAVHALILLEAEAGEAFRLTEAAEQIGYWLAGLAATGSWTLKLEGTWLEQDGNSSVLSQVLAGQAKRILQAEENGRFQDNGMLNLTFRSSLLADIVVDAGGTAMQTALRQDTETGEWKLAIGAPLLTGEF